MPKAKAGDDSFVPVQVNVADPRTLIVALKSPESTVAGQAALGLEKFVDKSEKNRVEVVKLGGIEAAIPLLSSSDLELKQQGSCFLSTITASKAARKHIAIEKLVVTKPMVALLAADAGPICHENACGYFANFAQEFSGRLAIASDGGVEALVGLLVQTVPDPTDLKAPAPIPDLLRNLLRAILLLCGEYDARHLLGAGDTGGIEKLLAVLDSEYSELQSLALSCLMEACRNTRNRMIVRVSGGLVKLLKFVDNVDYAVTHSQCLSVLAELLSDESAMAAVSERGPVDKQNPTGTPAPVSALVGFVSAVDNDTRRHALNCVCNAAKNAANRRILMDLKVEKAVAARLWSDDAKQPLNPKVASSAIEAAISLSAGESNAGELGAQGAIERLLKLISWDDDRCQVTAAEALVALTARSSDNKTLFVELDGPAKLAALFSSDDHAKHAAAAGIVKNIASSPKTKSSLTEISVVPGLMKCTSEGSTPAAMRAGLDAIAVLASDSNIRSELSNVEEFPKQLLGLSQHSEPDVQVASWLAIRAVSVETSIAVALCDLGILSFLSLSAHAFALAAFNQLLDSQLSAKYSYRGRLDLTDMIEAGSDFFDTGAKKPSSDFIGLSKLKIAPIKAGREVLLVSMSKPLPSVEDGEESEKTEEQLEAEAADISLDNFVSGCKDSIKDEATVMEKASALATAVSSRMGGAVAVNDLSKFGYELKIVDLKSELKSNVVPIGKITHGTYYHRSLLFKAVADQIGLLSSLVRSEYGRAYNVIYAPDMHVVDVMHDPGRIVKLEAHSDQPGDLGDLQLAGNFWEYATKAA